MCFLHYSSYNLTLLLPSFRNWLLTVIALLCFKSYVDTKNVAVPTKNGTHLLFTGCQVLPLTQINVDLATNTAPNNRFQISADLLSPLKLQSFQNYWNTFYVNTSGNISFERTRNLDQRLLTKSSYIYCQPSPVGDFQQPSKVLKDLAGALSIVQNSNVYLDTNTSSLPPLNKFPRSNIKESLQMSENKPYGRGGYSTDKRIFNKKIGKFLRNKLLLSFIGVVFMITLIKIKFFWLLPFIVGIGTAKKILLKVLLFIFPAISHLFQLCSAYQDDRHHQAKYHFHQHKIAHHHTVQPNIHNRHPTSSSVFLPNGPELIFTKPPRTKPSPFFDHGYFQAAAYYRKPISYHQMSLSDWESSGPGLGAEYIGDINRIDKTGKRNEMIGNGITIQNGLNFPHNLINRQVADNPQAQHFFNKDLSIESGASYFQFNPLLTLDSDDNMSNSVQGTNEISQKAYVELQQIKVSDTFFKNVVQRMDEIFALFGNLEENCKRLLVCRMYRSPDEFRPYSNFISAELSRDVNDLEIPAAIGNITFRFFTFVDAARIGQDNGDCSRFSSKCSKRIDFKLVDI